MTQSQAFAVRFSGSRACFSRPEFKVERVSYPVMTPSAARGALEAIFWKPEFRWEIRAIDVLKPIQETSLLRNEVAEAQSHRQGIYLVEEKRQQRSSLILRDVAYVVHAEMLLEDHATEPIPKYSSQFERRLERGQCFQQPYLGTREFVASFWAATGDEEPIADDRHIGNMLFDIAHVRNGGRKELTFRRHGSEGAREVSGYSKPLFFDAKLQSGRLVVPAEKYEELRRMEGR